MDSQFDSTTGFLGKTMGRLKILSRGSQTKLLCYMMLFSLFVFFVIYWIMKLRWYKLVWALNLLQLMSWGYHFDSQHPNIPMAFSIEDYWSFPLSEIILYHIMFLNTVPFWLIMTSIFRGIELACSQCDCTHVFPARVNMNIIPFLHKCNFLKLIGEQKNAREPKVSFCGVVAW